MLSLALGVAHPDRQPPAALAFEVLHLLDHAGVERVVGRQQHQAVAADQVARQHHAGQQFARQHLDPGQAGAGAGAAVDDLAERRQLEIDKQRLEALALRQNEELKALNQSLEAKVEARTKLLKVEHEATVAANNKLKTNFVTTIKIFSTMIELRAHNQPGHARQVADLARQLCVRLELDTKDSQDVFIAALLHDIGKIGFSDDMLSTPLTMLTGDSLGLFRKHPIRAAELLMPLEELRGSATILRAQLERFDGNGFPDGLAGLAIPLGARILSLAVDYYNLQQGGMVQRHLRPDEAKSLILDASGKRYDPNVVAAFRQIMDGGVSAAVVGVEVLSGELLPGMVLARDLISRDGLMLLTVDHTLDARMIQQVQDFESKSGGRLSIWVRNPKAD